MKKPLVTLLKFGISFCILAWLFYQTWQADQFDVLWSGQKNHAWLALALITGIGVALVSYFRWYLLCRALDLPIRYYDAVRLGFLGSLLNLLSIGVLGGDAVKAVFLARQVPGRAPEAVASVIFDRAIGLLAMFSFAGLAWLTTDFPAGTRKHETEHAAMNLVCQFALIMAVLGFIGLGVLFLTPRFTRTGLYRRLASLPRAGTLFKRMTGVALVYRTRFGSVIVAFLLSLLANVMFATTFFGIAAGISDTHPSYRQHLVISPIAMVANAVPLPGGLGGMEAAVSYLYRAFSSTEVPSEHGFVVALGFRLILLITAAIGFLFYLGSKGEIRELSKNKIPIPASGG